MTYCKYLFCNFVSAVRADLLSASCLCTGCFFCYGPFSIRMASCRNFFRNLISTGSTDLLFASGFCTGRFLRYCPVAICMACCRNYTNRVLIAYSTNRAVEGLRAFLCAGRFLVNCILSIPLMTGGMYDGLFRIDLIHAFTVTINSSALAAGPEFYISVFRAACLFCLGLYQLMDMR